MMNLNEQFQKIKMCIQTYINMFGTMPGIQEMVDWLGSSYLPALKIFMQTPQVA